MQKKEDQKNKIYFIWKFEKDAYLCTPNGNEGQKIGTADVGKITEKD
jgi:hypothetical protein